MTIGLRVYGNGQLARIDLAHGQKRGLPGRGVCKLYISYVPGQAGLQGKGHIRFLVHFERYSRVKALLDPALG